MIWNQIRHIAALGVALTLVVVPNTLLGQENEELLWWDPATSKYEVIEGSAWFDEKEEPYDRLPLRMKGAVRDPVWRLSKQSAGLSVRFYSNASSIHVRYQISGQEAMYHMPSTGVSGMDLFATDSEGIEHWIKGSRHNGDTISYTFSELTPNDGYHKLGREYSLYLPLYAQTRWLEIGVPTSSYFQPKPKRSEKPMVVYGTSIAQGACATRPGTAWTGMLTRWMDRPLINLGFSGNGRLEPELIELMSEIDAKVFILDCLPNLSADSEEQFNQVVDKIVQAVKILRVKRPSTPILLADHAGYTDGSLIEEREMRYLNLNRAMAKALSMLESEINLYHLPMSEFGQTIETMVDGTHPNDLGMFLYAKGYEKYLRKILEEPVGEKITMKPVRQRREPDLYEWQERHERIVIYGKKNSPETVIIGNSITHFWGGSPEGPMQRSPESWDSLLGSGVANFGMGWDRVENFLWRVYHDELDNIRPKTIVLLAGTNNLHLNDDDEIIEGMEMLINAIQTRQPDSKIVIAGILPRENMEDRAQSLNHKLSLAIDGKDGVIFTDIGTGLLNKSKRINPKMFIDGLHPNEVGYKILAKQLGSTLKKLN